MKPNPILHLMRLVVLGVALLAGGAVQAQAPAPTPKTCPQLAICVGEFTIQMFTAVATELVPKTMNWNEAAVITGVNIMTDRFNLPVGAGFGCGGGFSTGKDQPGASFQCVGELSVSNWGALVGGWQQFKGPNGDTVFQGVIGFAGTVNVGGTASAFKQLANLKVVAAGADK